MAGQSSCKTISSSWQENKTKPPNTRAATCLPAAAHLPSEFLIWNWEMEWKEGGLKSYKAAAQTSTETFLVWACPDNLLEKTLSSSETYGCYVHGQINGARWKAFNSLL